MYVSFLGISGALYLSVFEQPASRVFFGILIGAGSLVRDEEKERRFWGRC
jgi:hypothetical protein